MNYGPFFPGPSQSSAETEAFASLGSAVSAGSAVASPQSAPGSTWEGGKPTNFGLDECWSPKTWAVSKWQFWLQMVASSSGMPKFTHGSSPLVFLSSQDEIFGVPSPPIFRQTQFKQHFEGRDHQSSVSVACDMY